MVRRLTYDVALSPAVVRARLEEAADRPTPRYWMLPGTTIGKPVIGEVQDDRFWWRLRHKERASFAPWLTGRILSSPMGSTLIVELRSPFTRRAQVLTAGLA